MTLNRRRAVPLWLLGLFTFSGPVGMHIFVLPAAVKDLHATSAALELTISLSTSCRSRLRPPQL
jgi:MFS transporter, DHA1 family, multidrug resistance protein